MPSIYTVNQYFISSVSSNKNIGIAPHPKLALNLCLDMGGATKAIPYSLVNWLNPKLINFSSIGEAKRILSDCQKLWNYYPNLENGRGKLIEEQLFPIKSTNYGFLAKLPTAPIGAWTLLGKNKLLFSSATTSTVPYNIFNFEENKSEPPSRAYLKLWEFFTRTNLIPNKLNQAIDLGACPGGWTWVLSSLFRKVIALDKSPLRPDIQSLKNVEFMRQDVMQFSEKQDLEKNTWILSDVALAPDKIIGMLLDLRKKRPDLSFVCTLKFTNSTDLKILNDLVEIPNSNLIHLYNNKHEVTWYSINRDSLSNP